MYSRRRKVGTGSNEHDFAGDVMTMRRTSPSVHSRKDVSDDDVRLMTGGGANPEVSFRMSSIFLSKKAAKPSAL